MLGGGSGRRSPFGTLVRAALGVGVPVAACGGGWLHRDNEGVGGSSGQGGSSASGGTGVGGTGGRGGATAVGGAAPSGGRGGGPAAGGMTPISCPAVAPPAFAQ